MKNNNPLVSILVPVYNVELYLRQCLDSLITQTLTDIEIICVNDGSTDGSLDILNDYASTDNRIKIINKRNGGLPSARNAGLDAATGEYVGFVDGDDFVEPDMFKKLYLAAKHEKADIVVCGANCISDDSRVPKWLAESLSPSSNIYKENLINVLLTVKGVKPFLWRDLVKRELIEKYTIRLDETIVLGEDQAFQFKIFSHASSVVLISDKLYNYRWSRPQSIMNAPGTKDYTARLIKHIYMIDRILEHMQNEGCIDKNAVSVINWCVDFIYWDILKINAFDRAEVARQFVNVLIKYGYFNYSAKCLPHIIEKFNFIYDTANTKTILPTMTVVMAMDSNAFAVHNAISKILADKTLSLELLLYDNGSGSEVIDIVRDMQKKDSRICLRLGEWEPLCDKYNDAIATAKGKYILFANEYNFITVPLTLKSIADKFESDGTIDLIGYNGRQRGIADIKFCQNSCYRNFVFRLDKIRSEGIIFEDYSILTGSVFFTKYCLISSYVYFVDRFILDGYTLKRTWISVQEAVLALKALTWMLEIAIQHDLPDLRYKITLMLNSENYIRLLTDTSTEFVLDNRADKTITQYCIEIFRLLIQANKLACKDVNSRAVIGALAMFIKKRQQNILNLKKR